MGAKYIARHGAMRFLGEFEASQDKAYLRGHAVQFQPRTEHAGFLGTLSGREECDHSPTEHGVTGKR